MHVRSNLFADDLVADMDDLRLHNILIAFFIASAWLSTFE